MRFTPSAIGSIFIRSAQWVVSIGQHELAITIAKGLPIQVDLPTIVDIKLKHGLFWTTILIKSHSHEFELKAANTSDAKTVERVLTKRIVNGITNTLEKQQPIINNMMVSMYQLLKLDRYLARSQITQWQQDLESGANSIKAIVNLLKHPLASQCDISSDFKMGIQTLKDVFSDDSNTIKQRNQKFVAEEIQKHSQFFDSVEETPLTQEQRLASVVMEDRNLLVAAAGSGKTSTVIGKIGYALLKGLVKPNEILVLAFNKHAVKELEDRIHNRLGRLLGTDQVKVKTFHALGVEIIAEATNKKPSVANFAGGGEAANNKLLSDLIDSLLKSDSNFATQWILFLTLCKKSARNPAEFNSIEDWQEYVKQTGDYRDGKNGFLTLNGELVKSHGELAIANWFYLNGIAYEYESAYKYVTANKQYRQYKPDFYLPEIDCYLEHYALDKNGNPPKAFGDKYAESMAWKRELHAQKGTEVIETTFSEFIAGTLFEKLEKMLIQRGVKSKPRSQHEFEKCLNSSQINTELSSLIRTFIKHYKSNELDYSTLATRANTMAEHFRAVSFTNVVSSIISAYDSKLKALNEVDFEDLIVDAANHAASKQYTHGYKLILVDEFQDISRARSKLLLSLLGKSPQCQLFAVGDDWQSIYRFAGSDIGIFTNFKNIFGYSAINYLSKTFRSNQGIADIAAQFVQKNPSQLKKLVEAHDKNLIDPVIVKQYAKLQEIEKLVEETLEEIDAEIKSSGKKSTVYILGRYRHQSPESLSTWQSRYSTTLTIEFRTIHASKGLQSDYVILVGLNTGNSAFPSEIADDPLLKIVMPEAESYPNAEERRLFYVALTRARNRVYLLGGKYTPSSFLTELLK